MENERNLNENGRNLIEDERNLIEDETNLMVKFWSDLPSYLMLTAAKPGSRWDGVSLGWILTGLYGLG